jgi:hypothetical protein
MDLEKLQQEVESLQKIDASQLSSDQLVELVNKLSSILDQSEQSLINTTLIEINKIDNNDE